MSSSPLLFYSFLPVSPFSGLLKHSLPFLFYCSYSIRPLAPASCWRPSYYHTAPIYSCNFFLRFFYYFLTPFFQFPIFFFPSRPFSISTAVLINNASQHIKNISRVLLAVREREETSEGKEWLTLF